MAHCFTCGDEHPTGLRLRLVAMDGVAMRGVFTVTEQHMGGPGLAHGGILASAVDEVLGSLAWLLWQPAVTGRLEIDYRQPVPVGSTVVIDAWCTGVDGRKLYGEAVGRLGDENGPEVVRASAIFVVVGVEHFTRHATRGGDELRRSINP
jgi:acyl-coenzyme A thioesterase PaaI-like protein